MQESLLDTDILNEVLKQRNPEVVRRAAEYLSEFGEFAISSISRYEVIRGLVEKNASRQLKRFEIFCSHTKVCPVTDSVLDLAAHIWALGRQQGRSPNDADLVIAARAIELGRVLVTGNIVHFDWIPGLVVSNWRDVA